MGTQEPRLLTAAHCLRPDRALEQAPVDAHPVPDDPHLPLPGSGHDRPPADVVLEKILALIGAGRIARAAVAGVILLEPRDLHDGEQIARQLGLDGAVDYIRTTPPATVWSGTYLGVQVQVQTALRSTAGSAP